jgi:ketosteroid isomerase-like protein
MTGPETASALRAEIDAVLADWAWHIDHREFDELVGLFTENALFVTGPVELRGRRQIRQRYTARTGARSTRHMYSGLRLSGVGAGLV